MTSPFAPRYEFALALIKDAGALAHGYFKRRGELTIKSKGMQDMVSEADINTELLIKGRIAAHFPQDAFLGEETGLCALQEHGARPANGEEHAEQDPGGAPVDGSSGDEQRGGEEADIADETEQAAKHR